MTNKNEEGYFRPVVKFAVTVFAVYGICSFLEDLFKKSEEDKNEVKIKEVFKEIREGLIVKRTHIVTKEYCSQKN